MPSLFRYTWQKNGKPYDWQVYDDRISQQPGRGTLVITSPRDEDIGMYAFTSALRVNLLLFFYKNGPFCRSYHRTSILLLSEIAHLYSVFARDVAIIHLRVYTI